VNWIINRLREASTWRGLVWLLTVSGVALRPDQIEAIVLAGMALAGLIGVFVRDEIRSPETRTRETDISEINLVGRSESVQESHSLSVSGGDPQSFDPPIIRVRTASLQPNDEHQDPGSTLRQDGGGYNG
jgi:hypothetical protein